MPDAEEVCRANKQSVDRWLTVSHWAERVCIVLVLVVSVVSYSVAQARSVVDRIIIEGNRRVATESLQALIHTHIGDTYNQSARNLYAARLPQTLSSGRQSLKSTGTRRLRQFISSLKIGRWLSIMSGEYPPSCARRFWICTRRLPMPRSRDF